MIVFDRTGISRRYNSTGGLKPWVLLFLEGLILEHLEVYEGLIPEQLLMLENAF